MYLADMRQLPIVALRNSVFLTCRCLILQRSLWNETCAASQARPGNDNFYDTTVESYARQPLREFTLKEMLVVGQDTALNPERILSSARIVQEELPKRLARRLTDLQFLPHIVVTNPHIQTVYTAYQNAFDVLRALPPTQTHADNAHLTDVLTRLIDEHAQMIDSLAQGLKECHRKGGVVEHFDLQAFLDSMLRSRISRRVIAEQHVNLLKARPHHIGIINTRLSVSEAIEMAAAKAKHLCCESYGCAPQVHITGDLCTSVPQVSAHIDYILFEILKNSMRAVMERTTAVHRLDNGMGRMSQKLPPIQVRVCSAPDMTFVRLSDQGGGMPTSLEKSVWHYGFTTTEDEHTDSSMTGPSLDPSLGELMTPVTGQSGFNKMGGLGFGLPMARLHARYFGGDLDLMNLPGYGVDAFLKIRRLDQGEWLEGQHVHEDKTTTYSASPGP